MLCGVCVKMQVSWYLFLSKLKSVEPKDSVIHRKGKCGLHVYVRMYAFMYGCMCVRTYVCIYVWLYVSTYVFMYGCMCVRTYVCT